MKSDAKEMLKLLIGAKSNEIGLFPFTLHDIYRFPDKIAITEAQFIEITNSLLNLGLIEMSGAYYKLSPTGFDFAKKLENNFVIDKILADIDTKQNLTIPDVKSLVEKYHKENQGL